MILLLFNLSFVTFFYSLVPHFLFFAGIHYPLPFLAVSLSNTCSSLPLHSPACVTFSFINVISFPHSSTLSIPLSFSHHYLFFHYLLFVSPIIIYYFTISFSFSHHYILFYSPIFLLPSLSNLLLSPFLSPTIIYSFLSSFLFLSLSILSLSPFLSHITYSFTISLNVFNSKIFPYKIFLVFPFASKLVSNFSGSALAIFSLSA